MALGGGGGADGEPRQRQTQQQATRARWWWWGRGAPSGTAMSDLTDDILEEILLRLSPEERGLHKRAALVCSSWHRIISGSGFRRRYSALHRETIRRIQRETFILVRYEALLRHVHIS